AAMNQPLPLTLGGNKWLGAFSNLCKESKRPATPRARLVSYEVDLTETPQCAPFAERTLGNKLAPRGDESPGQRAFDLEAVGTIEADRAKQKVVVPVSESAAHAKAPEATATSRMASQCKRALSYTRPPKGLTE